jgi:hypothetical protein
MQQLLPLDKQVRNFADRWATYRKIFEERDVPFHMPNRDIPAKFVPVAPAALERLDQFVRVVAGNPELDIWDDKLFAETFLEQIGIRYPSKFMRLMETTDILEMYDLNNIQIFRNMNFMKICGYSLCDIAVHEWPVLFERSQVITKEIEEQIGRAVTLKTIVKLDVPQHYMKERFSTTRQLVRVNLRYASPIFDYSDQLAGFAVCCKADIVDEHPDRHDLRFI